MLSLRENEEKYRIMADLIQEIIIILDSEGNIIEVNNQLYNCLGYDPEEVMEKNILNLSLLTEQAKAKIKEEFFHNFNNNEVFCSELSFVTKNGKEKIGSVKVHPIKDDGGNVIKYFMIIFDVTEHKRLEKAILDSVERETQAYHQGRIEIIDNILHNVGNAINSVTVGIGKIQEGLTNSKFLRYFISLADAVKLHQGDFGDYVNNDPQGQKVAPFIMALANDLVMQNKELAKIADRVNDRARYIGDIIQMDKSFGSSHTSDVNNSENH
jgi:PAS domain S-box-containing protein